MATTRKKSTKPDPTRPSSPTVRIAFPLPPAPPSTGARRVQVLDPKQLKKPKPVGRSTRKRPASPADDPLLAQLLTGPKP